MLGVLLCCSTSSCLRKAEHPDPSLKLLSNKPLTPDQTTQLLNETGKNWLYGETFGETLLTIGGIVVFPPFAVYVVSNAGLSLAGYETMKVADALPEPANDAWSESFSALASVPGRSAALVADEPYRDPKRARMEIEKILNQKPTS